MKTTILLPSKVKVVSQDANKGIFEIENIFPGYGITIGNALRRVILSSIPGAAITSAKIKGVKHEFSTIDGVFEDVIEIILNLKQVRVKLTGDEPQKIFIKAKGIKEVKAKDIETPTQVEIINKNQHIATLTDKKAELEIELLVERGLGYVPSELRSKDKLEVGVISLDAIFTPIRKVNFESNNMRVGDQINFNKLTISIETDGSIDPIGALNKGIEIIVDQFKELMPTDNNKEINVEKEIFEAKKDQQEEEKQVKAITTKEENPLPIEEQSVRMLELPTRLTNILIQSSVKTIGKLIKKKEKFLLELKGIGDKGVEEIKDSLSKFKLTLRK